MKMLTNIVFVLITVWSALPLFAMKRGNEEIEEMQSEENPAKVPALGTIEDIETAPIIATPASAAEQGGQAFAELPITIQRQLLGYLTSETGSTRETRTLKAVDNIRNFMNLNKTHRDLYANNRELNGYLITELIKQRIYPRAQGTIFEELDMAADLRTPGALEWLKHQLATSANSNQWWYPIGQKINTALIANQHEKAYYLLTFAQSLPAASQEAIFAVDSENTPLLNAILSGNLKIFNIILTFNPRVLSLNIDKKHRRTHNALSLALIFAKNYPAQRDTYLKMATELVKIPGYSNESLINALQATILWDFPSIAEALLALPNIHRILDQQLPFNHMGSPSKDSFLTLATRFARNQIVQKLLEHPINLNFQAMPSRMTALMLAVDNGYHDISLPLLKRKDTNVNLADIYGMTALMFAVRRQDYDMVNAMLSDMQHHVDVNAKDTNGHAALWYARQGPDTRNKKAIIELLERFKAQ